MTCQHPNCTHEVYENNKCIFHCDKKDWSYINENDITQKVIWNVPKVNDFFRKFQSIIDNNTSERIIFDNFIIPIYQQNTYINSSDEEDLGFILDYKNIVNCNINFVSCIFLGYFSFYYSTSDMFSKHISFFNCEFRDEFAFKYIKTNVIVFVKNKTTSNITIKKSIIEKELIFVDNKIELFTIDSSSIEKVSNHKNGINNIEIFHSKSNNIALENSKFLKLYFKDTIFKNLYLSNIQSNYFYMHNCSINESGELYINNFTSKNFEIKNLSQLKSKILLSELKVENTFDLQYSDLYEANIKDIDLSNTQKVNLNNTSFLKTNFHYVTWGHTLDHIDAPRDTFRQLKRAYDEIGDHIEANKFYSMEMQKYREELKSNTKHRYDWQDKFLFTLNEYLSDFGRSWILPLLLIVSLTALMILGIETFESSSALKMPIPFVLSGGLILGYGVIFIFFNALMDYRKHFQVLLYWTASILAYYFYAVDAPFDCFARFISPSIDDGFKKYAFVWFIHKSLLGFLLYHFVTALRRQSKR